MDNPHGHHPEGQDGDPDNQDPVVPVFARQIRACRREHGEQHELDRYAAIGRRKEDIDHASVMRSPARMGMSSQLSSGGSTHEYTALYAQKGAYA